ncbi:pyridoxal phosphate-dependent transferase [Dichotomopilus funicola]|uniref:Pyridoxal phosphate-dependent transferase n=1 Tax=Dichotomopilus funicola TaxID=1934379 RepID=A0AAN6ZKL8_9PEZI|nr:pyridoxal phosphate-dependent transferase [Dichotomopilus funicola]
MTPSTNNPQDQNEPPQQKKLINLLRGWPAPALLPAAGLQSAANYMLADPERSVPVLQYGIDPGYQPLREEVARWLNGVYGPFSYPDTDPNRPIVADGIESVNENGQVTADEITITGGASQALACVLQSFTDPGYTRAVWVVAPCYFMACPIFEDCGFRGRLRAVPEDAEGVDVDVLGEKIRACEEEPWENHPSKNPGPDRKLYRHVIYLVATCANPSGKTLSLARREQLVRLARHHDALIISDDVYDLLQWPVTDSPSTSTSPQTTSLPPLLPLLSQIDNALGPSLHDPPNSTPSDAFKPKHFSHAISNASFSKLVGPGIRTGWIHGSAAFATGFATTGTNRSGGAASQFAAAVVWQMLRTGELEAHVDTVVRPALRRRFDLMRGEIREVLGPLGLSVWKRNGVGGAGTIPTVPKNDSSSNLEEETKEIYGGYFLWLTLPDHPNLDASAVAERAKTEENLIVAPGKIFEVAGDEAAAQFPRNVRLSFAWADEDEIVEGVARLGRVVRKMLRGEDDGVVDINASKGDTQEFK